MDWFATITYIAIPFCIYMYLGSIEGTSSKFTPCLHYSTATKYQCFQNATGIKSKESPCSDNLMDFDNTVLYGISLCYIMICAQLHSICDAIKKNTLGADAMGVPS